jgi:hypothetical protein
VTGERRYRIIVMTPWFAPPGDNVMVIRTADETQVVATSCNALCDYLKANFHPLHEWKFEYLSPSPQIGWQPMTRFAFENEMKRERREDILSRLRR